MVISSLPPHHDDTYDQHTASHVLEGVMHHHQADMIPMGDLLEALHERGFGLLMLILALPCSIPAPLPPLLPTILGLPLSFLAAQMALGHRHLWLPAWLRNKAIPRASLAVMIEKASPYLRMIERLLRPRLRMLSDARAERFIGSMAALFCIPILLPLPLSNFVPGVGVLVMSLGLIGRDGLIILFGMLIGLCGVAIAILVAILGKVAVMALFSGIFA